MKGREIKKQSRVRNKRRRQEKRRKRNITVIGDSMIKDIEGFKMRNGMNSYEKVFVKPFSGATISYIMII